MFVMRNNKNYFIFIFDKSLYILRKDEKVIQIKCYYFFCTNNLLHAASEFHSKYSQNPKLVLLNLLATMSQKYI